MTQAVVLVGGEGTRLRPLTARVPKPVLPLAGRPFIRYMLDWLRRHGVDDVVLACGFEPEALRETIGDGDAEQRVRYVVEPEPRGTGGGIREAAELLDERFLALNGDVLCDLDLTRLLGEHELAGATATVGLIAVDDATGYGLVEADAEGWVTNWAEKPDPESSADGGAVNAGAYVLERSTLDRIPPGRQVSIEREVFPELIGHGLAARVLDGYWLDIGTPDRFLQASWDILEGRVATRVGELAGPDGLLIEPGAEIDPDATVSAAALIGAGARIEPGAAVGPRAVVGPGCQVGAGARVVESVLSERCTLGEGASLSGAILAAGVEVSAGVSLQPGTVVGENELVAA